MYYHQDVSCSSASLHLCCLSFALLPAFVQVLGQRTEGFSGSDISTVVKDVLMQPIRLLRDATHFRKVCDAPSVGGRVAGTTKGHGPV